MARILHAGGPWKLESPRRHQETGVNAEARQANKVPGGRWGPRESRVLRSRGGPGVALDGLGSSPAPPKPPPCSPTPSSPGQDPKKVSSKEETETGDRVNVLL